ncbi:uncharacterized protein LOC143296191 isoform X2 [Babylonia areolata]
MEEGYTCMDSSRLSGNVSFSTSPSGAVASYSNQPLSTYLTPTSPTPSLAPQLPAFPASFSQPLSSQPLGPRHANPPFRADSGIEADSPSTATPSTVSTANPRGSTLYEYIDPKDVRVESEQPVDHLNNNTRGESTSSGVSSATTVPYSGDVVSDSEEATSNALRRRVNPMYEALEHSATRLYAQTCHCKTQSSAQRQLRYLWCSCVALIVMVIFLLCVLAYILFMLVPGLTSRVHGQENRLQLLETGYGKLMKQNQELLQIFPTNESAPDASLAASMIDTLSRLNSSVWTYNEQFHEVTSDLRQQISNISLTPGPQGPPGVGNLSLCFYTKSTTYQALPGPYSTTPWQPSTDILRDNMVMSATCGVIGGNEHFVESKEMNASFVQFRCRCDGSVDNYDRRACKIHLVLCPRLTGQDYTTLS